MKACECVVQLPSTSLTLITNQATAITASHEKWKLLELPLLNNMLSELFVLDTGWCGRGSVLVRSCTSE